MDGTDRDWPRGWRRGLEWGRGLVRFGLLRRLTPVSGAYGFDRGMPIDRYYIEDFLARRSGNVRYASSDVRGRVLEIGDDYYTRKFGALEDEGPSGVHTSDILHASGVNERATLVGDLASGKGVPSDAFDCIICTQVLHVIYDFRAAIATMHRALRPGGVALVTIPGITASCRPDRDHWGDWWRFTGQSAERLFAEVFGLENTDVEVYGNLLAAVAGLHGYAAQELRRTELAVRDPNYEVLIAVQARKASDAP